IARSGVGEERVDVQECRGADVGREIPLGITNECVALAIGHEPVRFAQLIWVRGPQVGLHGAGGEHETDDPWIRHPSDIRAHRSPAGAVAHEYDALEPVGLSEIDPGSNIARLLARYAPVAAAPDALAAATGLHV